MRQVHTEKMANVVKAVLIGMGVMLVGTIPRNILYFLNWRGYSDLPWAVVPLAIFFWFFWQYLNGKGPPASTSALRRQTLRANSLPGKLWGWSLLAGALGLVTLVIALRLLNRLVELPAQELPDWWSSIPAFTIATLMLVGAPIAGLIEESAFRGYMQGPIEKEYGIVVAILITGTMFAVAHLDFTLILWPYYVAVAGIYGMVTWLTNSILPAMVLHTIGNMYSNTYLMVYGRAEWQAPAGQAQLIWTTGVDSSFWYSILALVVSAIAMVWAYIRLAGAAKGSAKTGELLH